ncbi:MAG: filamentous hemagglutinin N-terminal domain-containing protein [Nitrospira sp.]|nr:MAG: filamentous hemagglutinin N-terminal domain-containing protein [Nitrospira sp.]
MSHRYFQLTKRLTQVERTPRSRHPDSIGEAFLSAILPMFILFLVGPAVVDAQVPVTTNITSSGLGTEVPLLPPPDGVYDITGGTRPGGGLNLFHSFGDFTVGSGNIANFLNTPVAGSLPLTSNIIGRVTELGPEHVSYIYGTIRTTDFDVGGLPTNLFLVNPNGIVFGPEGSFELGGAVNFSTANYLGFDGTTTLFDMLSTPVSLGQLDVAPVVAFGFTSLEPPAPITVQGSILQVSEGQSLSLVGGDVTVQAGTLTDGTPQTAVLRAPGGQINLVSVASPGEVLVPGLQTDSFTAMGTVTIKEGSILNVGGQFDELGTPIGNGNSGTLFVRGGQLVMDASAIVAVTLGAVDGASRTVDIQVSKDVSLSNSVALSTGAAILVGTSGSGQGGDVVIEAEHMGLSDGSLISTAKSGSGSGGNLFLNVGTLGLQSGFILSSTQGADLDFDGVADVIAGAGGNITVQGLRGIGSVADSVVLSGGSGIASEALEFSESGGRIFITTTSLDLNEASSIGSSTSATKMDLNGDGVVDITGRGGEIVANVQSLGIFGGSSLSSSTRGSNEGAADGGTVTVQGLGGLGSKAGSVVLSGQDTLIVSDSDLGLPGDITVNAGTLTITNGAVISAGSGTSFGPAGNVMVTADLILISAGGLIQSQSFAQDAGQVTITADKLTLDNGSIVTSTRSESGGRGGNVVVNGGTVSLRNGASIKSQSETSTTTGSAGDIAMTVGSLTLANSSEITSSSKGTVMGAGDAGNITIQSGSTVLLNDSAITTEASEASGGKIVVNAPEMIRLTNSRISTSVKGVAGDSDGGNISIDPQFFILQNSQLVAQANAGAGGAINVIAGVFIADPNSLVSATSESGPQGTVNIQSPVQNVGGELAALSDEFASAAALLAQQCAARVADGKFSTFVVAGREGLPLEPGGFLASPSLSSELVGSTLSWQRSATQFPAVTGLFPIYDARPIQLAMFGNTCR